MGGDDGGINFVLEQLFADLFFERRIVFGEEAAFALDGLDDALVFELRVGFGDRVTIDPQLLSQGANGRQRLARLERAGSGGVTDLVGQLEINRRAGLKINLEEHFQLS